MSAPNYPDISSAFGGPDRLTTPPIPIGPINMVLNQDKAGFFDSLISAGTKEMIGMTPDPSVERYRAENPVRGFTSQVLPELALFAIPGTKIGAIAVKNFKPAAKLVEYGIKSLEAGHSFRGAGARELGRILPVLGARQAVSLLAPEEGSFGRIAERNAVDLLFGGAFVGSAEFLRNLRGTSALELRSSLKDPEKSLVTIQKYFKDAVDLNNPPQDQLASLLRLEADPQHAGHPVMTDVRRAIGLMRAEVLKQEPPPKRPWINSMGSRKKTSALNNLFKKAVPILDLPDEAGVRTLLPKDFEAFSKYPKALSVTGGKERNEVWRAINDNLERIDANTFIGQENSEGLFVVVKKVQSAMDNIPGENRLFLGRPDMPDRYLMLKTSKPWEFVDGSISRVRELEDLFAYDKVYRKTADTGFLDSRLPRRGPRTFQMEDGVEVTALPNTTPTFDAIRRDVELARPWQKGLYGLVEAGDKLETPEFFKSILDRLSKTVPVSIPFSSLVPQAVKDFSFEAGHLIRESARASRKVFAPAAAGSWNARSAVLNRLTGQAFHRMLGRARQILWGDVPDEVLKGNYVKNMMLRMHDPRTGGILGKAVYALDTPEALEGLTTAWRMRWTPDEAAKNGVASKVVEFMRDLGKHDFDQIMELKASRAAAGIEDDFVPLMNHYSMSRMWPGKFRVELYDDLTGDLVGYAGGHSPKNAMDNAADIVRRVNSEAGEAEGKLRTPIREHLSTTEHVHFSKELATDARELAREVDAFQRGAKISANNLLTQRVIRASQRLMMDDPSRFQPRAGFLGWTGQFKSLTLDEVLESITANTVETQRLITKEGLVSQLAPEISKLRSEYPDLYAQWAVRFNSHLGYQGPVAKAIDRLIDVPLSRFMGSQGGSRLIRQMNRGMFNLTLSAGDLGFLAVNTASGVQTIMPEAAMLLGHTPGRISQYYDLMLMNTKYGPRVASFLSPAKITWEGVRELLKASGTKDPELVAALARAHKEGIISKPIIAEIREFGEAAAEQMKAKNPVQAIMQFNENLVGRTEEFTRAWAFVVGRKIGKDFFAMNEENAFELARRFVSRSMYEYSAGDRARITTGAIGSGWGLFKNWTMHYVANLMAYSNEAVWKNNWGPLMWAMIGTGSVGGAVAMPGYGVANSFAKFLSNKDLQDWTYEAAGYGGEPGKMAADGFNYGLPSLMGMTMQGRASAPGSQVIRDSSLFLNMALFDRAQGLYNFMGNTIDQIADGNVNVMSDRRVQRTFMQAFAPRTLQRAYTYWGQQGLESLRTGNRLINRVSKTDAFMHTIGMTPLEVERTFDVTSELFEDVTKLRKKIQFYGESYADAWAAGDFDELRRIDRRAHAEGIPVSSVWRSGQSRIEKDHSGLLDRQFEERIVRRKKQLRGF